MATYLGKKQLNEKHFFKTTNTRMTRFWIVKKVFSSTYYFTFSEEKIGGFIILLFE